MKYQIRNEETKKSVRKAKSTWGSDITRNPMVIRTCNMLDEAYTTLHQAKGAAMVDAVSSAMDAELRFARAVFDAGISKGVVFK